MFFEETFTGTIAVEASRLNTLVGKMKCLGKSKICTVYRCPDVSGNNTKNIMNEILFNIEKFKHKTQVMSQMNLADVMLCYVY